jgi:hypothetical protein
LPTRLDLQPLWQPLPPRSDGASALEDPWGRLHRPDWAARGLIIWPRGGQQRQLRWRLERPANWADLAGGAVARLCLRWWAEAAELHVDGVCVHRGDLFDTACRWPLPQRWWQGEPLELKLLLVSPRHDDGALIHSRLELEPSDPADPLGLLKPVVAELEALRAERGLPAGTGNSTVRVLGHAHLDLAWLWPVADTWQAAERTFDSALTLMERWPELRFGHSTPALYAWLEQHRPALFARIRAAMRQGRWEPLNGPWVESDCQLIETASLLRQFQLGQRYSRRALPEWQHELAWLPDSFGFAAGLPAIARFTGVRWFCTHKLAWNAGQPFPHRLFRWRSRCGAELLALMTAPIGTDGDPLAIEAQRLEWQRISGADELLWLPGVGDHGGGPTAEMLEQLALWQRQPAMAPLRHGSLREHLAQLEPLAPRLPVWRDELYLELHRGCATSRPDQKRHNRTLERLLREAELARALLQAMGRPDTATSPCGAAARALPPTPDQADGAPGATSAASGDPRGTNTGEQVQPGGETAAATGQPAASCPTPGRQVDNENGGRTVSAMTPPRQPADAEQRRRRSAAAATIDWRPLLFQQFHDILPGTSIPEVFEQAEPEWRAARRQARRQRDLALLAGLGPLPATQAVAPGASAGGENSTEASGSGRIAPAAPGGSTGATHRGDQAWWLAQLHPLAAAARCRRLPAGHWRLANGPQAGRLLASQPAREGGVWLQLPLPAGVGALALRRAAMPADDSSEPALAIAHPVRLSDEGGQRWLLSNGLVSVRCGPAGLEQLWDAQGRPLLGAPLRWCRWRDQGEFWDAWDIAADHGDHPLPWTWQPGPELQGDGPLCAELVWRGRCGNSPLRLSLRLLAGSPAVELQFSVHWRQRHELLQLQIPLAAPQPRWAADCTGGVIERPAQPRTPREQARWEVTALSWIAAPQLAVLLDGPQGVSAAAEQLSVSLLRAPTWPDPGADNGWQRQRLALLPAPDGWRRSAVPEQARRLREPLWLHPALSPGAAAPRSGEWPAFPWLGDDLGLVGLRPAGPMSGAGESCMTDEDQPGLILTVQNEGPCRQRLALPPPWRVLQRLDGLDGALSDYLSGDPLAIAPWQLACWRIDWGSGASP